MSEERRQQLYEEAVAQIDRVVLGLPSAVGYDFVVDIEPDPRDIFSDRSLLYFALGYSRAFDVLWDAAYARWSATLEYPLLFACRHSIELWLKAALSTQDEDKVSGHGLARLWQRLMHKVYDSPPDAVGDMYAKAVLPLVTALDEHDGAKGDRFRYPTDRRFEPYLSSEADLEDLCRAHSLITGYCDAVCTQAREEHNFAVSLAH